MLPRNTPRIGPKTNVVTLPDVNGVTWLVDGKEHPAGKVKALDEGQTIKVEARVADGRVAHGLTEWEFAREKKQ